jgi:hypothetical protein
MSIFDARKSSKNAKSNFIEISGKKIEPQVKIVV